MASVAEDTTARIASVQDRLANQGIDVLIIGPSEDLQYLIGYTPLATERLTAFVIPSTGTPLLIVPKIEAPNFQNFGDAFTLSVWDETQDPVEIIATHISRQAYQQIGINEHLWSGFLIRLIDLLPEVRLRRGALVLEPMRTIKSQTEVETLREASKRIDAVWEEFCATSSLTGRTEMEIAARLITLMYSHGFSHVAWCDVGSGANGASPLHHGSDRVIQQGDPVVIDFAGTYEGYYADICRTPVAGNPDPDFEIIYDIVLNAQEQAFQAVRPGVPCQDIDRTARKIITDHGYGEFFIHRVGHGLGASAHEHPYIVEGNDTPLEVGMVFSDEPGIYIPGRWGVRIEDILLVTPGGAERLNNTSRELIRLP